MGEPRRSRGSASPSIFLRLLLSNLILLAVCFAAGMLLFEHLFASGVWMFLEHHPVVILPLVIILIGTAGLLASWTATAISLPLTHMTESLKSSTPDAHLHTYDGPSGCEETEELEKELLGYLACRDSRETREQWKSANETISDIAIIDVDANLNIISVNNAAKRVFGQTDNSMQCGLAVFLFGADAPSSPFGVLNRIGIEQVQLRNERCVHKSVGDEPMEISWSTTNLYDTDGAYIGKRLFGGIAGDM